MNFKFDKGKFRINTINTALRAIEKVNKFEKVYKYKASIYILISAFVTGFIFNPWFGTGVGFI